MSFTPLSALISSTDRPHTHPVAIDDNGNERSWRDFTRHVMTLSHQLAARPEKEWALAFEDSYLFSVAFFALCHANKSVILPGNLQPGALTELTSCCDGILHDTRVIAPKGLLTLTLPDALIPTNDALPALQPFTDLKLTLFTSGSSGVPKAIEKSLHQLQEELNQLEQQWGKQVQQATFFSTVSHQHIYGFLFRILWPLSAGRPFMCRDLVYPEQVIAQAKGHHVLVSSPALLKRLSEQTNSDGYCSIFSSGGPLPYDAAQLSIASLGYLPIEVYGSTETGGIGFRQQTSESSPWRLFDGITASLNESGCLSLRSPYIDPQQWYHTADICELFDDRHFLLKGRADRVVKVEEKRVSLTEIEQRLCQSPWVTDAASVVLSQGGRQVIAAVVVLSAQGLDIIQETSQGKFKLSLRHAMREWLEPIAIPRRLKFVQNIPQNSQGKRQHSLIEALFTDE
ncbi:AMP-binding protein [Enterovibrio makurazakiensis]|uniref:AMP-binding protein n=1 Tax=Enterovibrio makurazakiensis TaxID=2910232 RepID=UPI003D22897C